MVIMKWEAFAYKNKTIPKINIAQRRRYQNQPIHNRNKPTQIQNHTHTKGHNHKGIQTHKQKDNVRTNKQAHVLNENQVHNTSILKRETHTYATQSNPPRYNTNTASPIGGRALLRL